MRVISPRSGWLRRDRHVSSEEEARLALAEMIDPDIGLAVCDIGLDEDLRAFHNGQQGAQRRTLGDAVDGTDLLGDTLAAYHRKTSSRKDPLDRPALEWCIAGNPLDWPQGPAALRRDPALAELSVAELAAHLNSRIREEAAELLIRCADYRSAHDDDRSVSEEVSELIDFEVDFDEFIEALLSGGHCWTPLCDWTPTGGALGDPFTVCRYAWGPLRAAVKLEPAELLGHHLAGDAELALCRSAFGDRSPHLEVIWPQQSFQCCGRDWVPEVWLPFWVDLRRRGQPPDQMVRSRDAQCKLCGAVSEFSWLTCRMVHDEPARVGDIERLDAVPEAALASLPEDLRAAVGLSAGAGEPERSGRCASTI